MVITPSTGGASSGAGTVGKIPNSVGGIYRRGEGQKERKKPGKSFNPVELD